MAMTLTLYATTLFINDERLRLIDEQIEQTTTALLAAGLDKELIEDIDQFDFLLAEKLEFQPPNLFLIIFDNQGKTVYQNHLARYHSIEPRRSLGWNTTLFNRNHLRSITIDIKNGKQFLEVGLILNRTNEIWGRSSIRLFLYILLIFFFAATIAFFLTQYLLKPIKHVSTYLTHMASHLQHIQKSDPKPIRSVFFNEFNSLIQSVNKLKKKIEDLINDRSLFLAQMTHELKTPLAIIVSQLESLPESAKSTLSYKNIIEEIDQMVIMIQEFLEWSSLSNIPVEMLETDALKIGDLTLQIVDRIPKVDRARISIQTNQNFYVFANASLLRQLLSNLISNALKYSSECVEISIGTSDWSIRDRGGGLPPGVIKRLGQPFNRFSIDSKKSTGLGLAWALTICKKYNWPIEIRNLEEGAEIQITFPLDKS